MLHEMEQQEIKEAPGNSGLASKMSHSKAGAK